MISVKIKRRCSECQEELKWIAEEINERLQYAPAPLLVIEEACEKYACPRGCTVVTPKKPLAPIGKGLPGPGLLPHVAVCRYGDHVPPNCQEEIFRRQGVELSRQSPVSCFR